MPSKRLTNSKTTEKLITYTGNFTFQKGTCGSSTR